MRSPTKRPAGPGSPMQLRWLPSLAPAQIDRQLGYTVVATREEDGLCLVDLELAVTGEDGKVTTPGAATVVLHT